MPAAKIVKFLGIAPKLSSENIPDTVAQVASNVKLYSGDLIPVNKPGVIATLDKGAGTKSIFPMDDGAGGFKWLHWTTDVDAAKVPMASNSTQRTVYSGDSEPRITDYALATTGAGTNYPYAYYTLGLPTPLTAPTVSANTFTTLTTATRSRDSGNTATLTFSAAHGLNTGAYVTVTLLAGTGYNLSNVQITVLSATSFSYFSTGAAETSTADTAGRVNIGGLTQSRTYVYTWYTAWGEESTPSPVSSAIYLKEGQVVSLSALPSVWPVSYTGTYQTAGMKLRIYRTIPSASGTYYYKCGEVALGTTTFTDSADALTLTTILPSSDYDQPDASMIGIRAIHNGMMMGFLDNTVCFSEPGFPHAWPLKYRVSIDANVVALGNFGSAIIVATDANPWLIQGASPSTMAKQRMDYVIPCTSKRSLVNMGYGVTYAAPQGLAVYSSQTGGTALTKYVHDWDTWSAAIDKTALSGHYYRDHYFGCDGSNTFQFQRDDQMGGYLTTQTYTFTAGYYDSANARFYFVANGVLKLWDDPAEVYDTLDWKSKTIVTKDYGNLGAARVVADYSDASGLGATVQLYSTVVAANAALIGAKTVNGGIGSSGVNVYAINGGALVTPPALTDIITFTLYANKQQIFSTALTSSEIFRMPTGYRTDTYEVRVSGDKRIRAIHLGETPLGLKAV